MSLGITTEFTIKVAGMSHCWIRGQLLGQFLCFVFTYSLFH